MTAQRYGYSEMKASIEEVLALLVSIRTWMTLHSPSTLTGMISFRTVSIVYNYFTIRCGAPEHRTRLFLHHLFDQMQLKIILE